MYNVFNLSTANEFFPQEIMDMIPDLIALTALALVVIGLKKEYAQKLDAKIYAGLND